MSSGPQDPREDEKRPESEDDWATWLVDAGAGDNDTQEWATSSEEDLAAGGQHLLDLVAAVDYLRAGHRSGLTIWDALEEALRWWAEERQHLLSDGAASHPTSATTAAAGDQPDPLLQTIRQFANCVNMEDASSAADALQQAVRRWCAAMAERYNNGHHWPHPLARRTFPPPVQKAVSPDGRSLTWSGPTVTSNWV